jgi:Flp pilus assembly protein TadD
LDGAIAEERQALRLNPNNDLAHSNLGGVLGGKGDWDGAIVELREAVRLDPKNHLAHYNLGGALEGKGDLKGALVEYRAAHTLNPGDPDYKQAYEGLLKKMK